jgi:hypothetical protein
MCTNGVAEVVETRVVDFRREEMIEHRKGSACLLGLTSHICTFVRAFLYAPSVRSCSSQAKGGRRAALRLCAQLTSHASSCNCLARLGRRAAFSGHTATLSRAVHQYCTQTA